MDGWLLLMIHRGRSVAGIADACQGRKEKGQGKREKGKEKRGPKSRAEVLPCPFSLVPLPLTSSLLFPRVRSRDHLLRRRLRAQFQMLLHLEPRHAFGHPVGGRRAFQVVVEDR